MSDLQRLTIRGTRNTPYIDLDPQTGLLIFQGASIAENPESFFRPVYQWLENYIKNPRPVTTVKFFLYFFNTSSSMRILEIFKKLKRLNNSGHKVKIYWYLLGNDEDMREAGTDYQTIIEIPFEFISVDDKNIDLHTN